MTMDKAEIVIDYRRAANKQKQIKILAQLNQCAERKIAEILVDAGEELPKKWQEQLLKPARRSWKFPEGEASREPSVVSREETEAEQAAPVAPRNADEARHWTDGVGPEAPEATEPTPMTAKAPEAAPEETATVTPDPTAWDWVVERKIEPGEITAERLLRAACRLMAGAMYLEPPAFHRYSAGVLDLVHALLEEDG